MSKSLVEEYVRNVYEDSYNLPPFKENVYILSYFVYLNYTRKNMKVMKRIQLTLYIMMKT